MTIIYTKGDMFKAETDALVNTVNCVGVMGKGVALEFKRRWPNNFKAYKEQCDSKKLRPGHMFIFDNSDILEDRKPRYLINFPTKDHWRAKSKIEFVRDGLDDFADQVKKLGIRSVALPPLGCGNGGLDWLDVKRLIEKKLSHIDDIEFHIYEPQSYMAEAEHIRGKLEMTLPRAMLIKALGDFEKYFGGYLTRISAQKITYFLQAFGVNFELKFAKNDHGPYSESLSKTFRVMESSGYITGYSGKTPQIRVTNSAYASADDFLSMYSNINADKTLQKLSLLIDGFESPFGMELLASVHFLAIKENKVDLDSTIKSIHSWNDKKREIFSDKAIESAFLRLKDDGLVH